MSLEPVTLQRYDLNSEQLSSGILLVDKPVGVTSFDVVAWARKVTGVRKIGHTGTLDPAASGLLVLLIGKQYTKLQDSFQGHNKVYSVSCALGAVSATGDLDTRDPIVFNREKAVQVSIDQFEASLLSFVGTQQQQVPAFSAVHVAGKRLHEVARLDAQAAQLLAPHKTVTISALTQIQQIAPFDGLPQFSFTLACSAGTYVRSLVSDLGKKLGCGAVVTRLRRLQAGEFSLSDAVVCPVIRFVAK